MSEHITNIYSAIALSLFALFSNFGTVLTASNVLFIIIDDLRPILSCFGDQTAITPNIDQIAYNGVIFANAFSQQSLCSPSRTSLLTSRRPDTLRLYDAHSYWRNTVGNFTTLPQYFKMYGYYTQSVGKVFHPGIVSNHSDDYPLSWSSPAFHGSTEKYKFASVCPTMDGELRTNLVCPVDVESQPEQTLPDMQSTQFAVNFINDYNTSSGVPFFLAIGFHKPHIPLKFPKQYLDLYPLNRIKLAPNLSFPKHFPVVAWNPWSDLRTRDDIKRLNISFPFGTIPHYFQKYIRQSYYASTTYIDDLIGQLLRAIQLKDLTKNTIVVLLGDHGWSLGEHSEWSKYSNFDVALRVPLIITIPNQATRYEYISPFMAKNLNNNSSKDLRDHSIIVRRIVELVDIFPTLCDICHLPVPSKCSPLELNINCTEGHSLRPLLSRNNPIINWKSVAFSQYPRPSFKPQADSDQPKLADINIMGYTMRTPRLRYTEWIAFDHRKFYSNWSHVYARELYFDEYQNINVAYDRKLKKIINKLSKQLRNGWRRSGKQK